MPVTRRWAYLDHAAVCPLPEPTRQTLIDWAVESSEHGDTVWPQWSEHLGEVRRTAARLIAANESEIALVANTTTGLNLIAEGYPWQEGENVVVLGNEFPSNQYPWLNLASRGVEARVVPTSGAVDPAALWDACDSNTRLLAISWVGFATGWRIDLEELIADAHARRIQVVLDAIQGWGVFPLDVRSTGVDFAVADGHKWLLGPEGAGLLYIREQHLERLRPLGVGWHSVKHRFDFSRIELEWADSASRFEGGSHNMPGFLALGTSLQLLERFGLGSRHSRIADRVLEISDQACERLRSVGAIVTSPRIGAHRSGIVSFQMPNRAPLEVRRHCLAAGVALSYRQGALRISPHAYNDESDLDQLISALRTA
ncbi:MAG: aminotransferase class V-fold PLP-dependent enzyme [Planctomycetes bacterium]|nr:aminotransferase class V-fold PLP-dependent enzyme [Planctomycetota bacterium]